MSEEIYRISLEKLVECLKRKDVWRFSNNFQGLDEHTNVYCSCCAQPKKRYRHFWGCWVVCSDCWNNAVDMAGADALYQKDAGTACAEVDQLRQKLTEWQDLFDGVAAALNCLPSTFTDGNAHVIRAADQLRQRVADLEAQLHASQKRGDRNAAILGEIYERIYPEVVTKIDGRTWGFRADAPHDWLQSLADRIRAIPEEMGEDEVYQRITKQAAEIERLKEFCDGGITRATKERMALEQRVAELEAENMRLKERCDALDRDNTCLVQLNAGLQNQVAVLKECNVIPHGQAEFIEAVETYLETTPCDCSDKRRYEAGEHMSGCHLFDLEIARQEYVGLVALSLPPA